MLPLAAFLYNLNCKKHTEADAMVTGGSKQSSHSSLGYVIGLQHMGVQKFKGNE